MKPNFQYRLVSKGDEKYKLLACQCPKCKKIVIAKNTSSVNGVWIDYTECSCGYGTSQINTSPMNVSIKDALVAAGVIVFLSLLTTEVYIFFSGIAVGVALIAHAIICQMFYSKKIKEANYLLSTEERKLQDAERTKNQQLWNAYKTEVEEFKKNYRGRLIVKKDEEKAYIGRDEQNLYLMPCDETPERFLCGIDAKSTEAKQVHEIVWSKVKDIPICRIDYFMLTGKVSYSTKVSGGNSGIGGATVGYALGGSLGAALLSNPTEIKSEEIKHDERRVYLQYSKDTKTYSLNFMPSELASIRELIPEKEYGKNPMPQIKKVELVQTALKENTEKKVTSDVFDTLKKLSELKEQGILTEDEFNKKKEELLKNIK